MKCAVIIADKIKQIMLTPENDSERMALNFITSDDEITLDVEWGTLYNDTPPSARGYTVSECKGGWLRAYEQKDALMLVLKPKMDDAAMEACKAIRDFWETPGSDIGLVVKKVNAALGISSAEEGYE